MTDQDARREAENIAVELERLGRHYSDAEGVMVIEIPTGRLLSVLTAAISRLRATPDASDRETAMALIAQFPSLRPAERWMPLIEAVAAALAAARRAAVEQCAQAAWDAMHHGTVNMRVLHAIRALAPTAKEPTI